MPTTDNQVAGERRRRYAAQGHREGRRAGRKIAIVFDDESFEQVRALAVERNVSFAKTIRELVEFGLLDIEEGRRG